MRVYIAGSFAIRDELAKMAAYLRERNFDVTSSWLREPPLTIADEREEWEKRARANEDLLDIERSDCVLMATESASSTGGYFVELGIAVGQRKPVYIIGPKRNIFFWLNLVTPVEDVEEFIRACN